MNNKKISNEDIINFLKEATTAQVMQLRNEIKDFFQLPDIVAASPTAAAVEEKEEQTEFSIYLKSAGSESNQKINAIKILRSVTNLGLKEAKDAVDSAPSLIKEGISKEEVQSLKKQFEDVGATVEIK